MMYSEPITIALNYLAAASMSSEVIHDAIQNKEQFMSMIIDKLSKNNNIYYTKTKIAYTHSFLLFGNQKVLKFTHI